MKLKKILITSVIVMTLLCVISTIYASNSGEVNETEFLKDSSIVIYYEKPYTSDEYVIQDNSNGLQSDTNTFSWSIDAKFLIDVNAVYNAYLSDEPNYSLDKFKDHLRNCSEENVHLDMDYFKSEDENTHSQEYLMDFFNTVSNTDTQNSSSKMSVYVNDDCSILTITFSGKYKDTGSAVNQKYDSFKNVTSDDVTVMFSNVQGIPDLKFENVTVISKLM